MVVSILLSLLGCLSASDSGDSGDSSTVSDVAFSTVRDQVLLPSCGFSSCHGGGAGSLTLEEGGVFGALVGVLSSQVPEMLLVSPGEPSESYLYLKLVDAEGVVGTRMPPGGGVEADRIELVRAWIEAGALED